MVSKIFPDLVDKIVPLSLKSSGEVWEWSASNFGPLILKLLTQVSEAPLNKLPKYIASRFPEVRKAAKTRFAELYP